MFVDKSRTLAKEQCLVVDEGSGGDSAQGMQPYFGEYNTL